MLTSKGKKLSLGLIVISILVMAPSMAVCQDIEIQVSPSILNLQSNGVVVTIHADIAYADVDASTVALNGVEIDSWKADNIGYFVAKFDMDDIKGLEGLRIGEYNTVTLSGSTIDGELFTGSEDVLVINNIPKGK